MNPIYVIGDIHGEFGMFEHALELVQADGGSEALTVFLGDYVDRGPDSRKVLDLLIRGQKLGQNWVFLKGNHDRMFEWFLQTPSRSDPHLFIDLSWLHERLGGRNTLMSYGLNFSKRYRLNDLHAATLSAVPNSHHKFLANCKLSYETNDLFFCHAGIRPNVELQDQNEEDLLWIREEFHNYSGQYTKLIVHGHTPIEKATHYANRVNLDSGSGYGKSLTAAVFEGTTCHILTAKGRVPMLAIR
jgi:serine/threonine protein phosphatase 1